MRKINKHISSPFGKLFLFLIIMSGVVVAMLFVMQRREYLKDTLQSVVREPLEISWTSPLTDIESGIPLDTTVEKKKATVPETPTQKKVLSEVSPKKKIKIDKPEKIRYQTTRRSFRQSMLKPYCPPIGLYTANPRSVEVDPNSIDAPYGRMLRCELINTVATSNLQTPVIGLVTEPLWWNGKEIIPAGVEVHGVASSSPIRDRIGTGTKWLLVWPHRNQWNGKALPLSAVALACDRTAATWGDNDGSAGIKGEVISDQEQKQLYAYIASFLSGLGEGMVSQKQDTTGSSTIITTGGKLQDALGSALEKSAGAISQQLFKELSKTMFYVKAQAGTEFYLYIRQDIILAKAKKSVMVRTASVSNRRR
jgi:hypothetical protein